MRAERVGRGARSGRAIAATLALALGAWAPFAVRAEQRTVAGAETARPADGFVILQINDTYKIEGLEAGRVGGMARVRTLRKSLEAEGRPVLVLHAGDLLFPSVASKYLKGRAMIAALNRLDGSDAFDDRFVATFGNHEFDDRDPAVLLARLAGSRFRWVSSNVRFRPPGASAPEPWSQRLSNVHETLLLELGGVKLGILAVTNDDQPRAWLATDYLDRDARYRAVRGALDRLHAGGAEFVVALTHQELSEDERLAADFPEIDRIVGGHEHVYLERRIGGVWITKADADAKSAVRIDVARSEDGKLASSHRRIGLEGTDVAPDPEMLGEVASWLVRLERTVREATGKRLLDVVATTEHALEGVEPAIRGRETALGDFLTDVLRERLATDIALLNGGAVRVNDDVPAGGDVRVYEMEGIFYYDNRPVAFEVTGTELLELLRKSVSETRLGHGRFLQVSGLRFRYHARGGEGADEETRVELVEVDVQQADGSFRPLEPDRRYSVASLDYLWKFGFRDGYPLFSGGGGGASPPLLPRPELSWRAITEEAIAALPGRRITSRIEGRIVRVEE